MGLLSALVTRCKPRRMGILDRRRMQGLNRYGKRPHDSLTAPKARRLRTGKLVSKSPGTEGRITEIANSGLQGVSSVPRDG